MQKCPYCKVWLVGERRACPLCGKKLDSDISTADENYEVFPKVAVKYTYDFIFKISTFLSILAIIVINIINFAFIPHLVLYVPFTLSVICAWIIVNVGFMKRKNIPKNIMYEAVISVLLCLVWDKMTGWGGWSVGYVLPAISASLVIFYFVMGIADRRRLTAYTGYFAVSTIGIIVTFILMLCGVYSGVASYFAVISVGVGATLLLAQVIFRGRNFASELHRWLHM